jgi:DNA-directed RNA polymerase subunit RPC12/RpoP
MAKYYCKSCGYRFQTKSDKKPRTCPYCGKSGTLVKEGTAQDIIEEALKEDFGDFDEE